MAGVGFSFFIYYFYQNFHLLKVNPIILNIYNFFAKKWLFDFIYLHFIYKPFFFFSYFITLKTIDRGLLEYFGPLGIVRYFNKMSTNLNNLQSGLVFHYIFFSTLVVMFFISLVLFFGNTLLSVVLSPELLFFSLSICIIIFNTIIKAR